MSQTNLTTIETQQANQNITNALSGDRTRADNEMLLLQTASLVPRTFLQHKIDSLFRCCITQNQNLVNINPAKNSDPGVESSSIISAFNSFATSVLDRISTLIDKMTESFRTILTEFSSQIKSIISAPGGNVVVPTADSNQNTAPRLGQELSKTGQFLWKPKSEKDGRLVILLPKKLGRAKSVRVVSPDGKSTISEGKFSGIANGDRAHYRFSKSGASMPSGSIVEITLENGNKLQTIIKETSKRYQI